jgi:hypothetical protein
LPKCLGPKEALLAMDDVNEGLYRIKIKWLIAMTFIG